MNNLMSCVYERKEDLPHSGSPSRRIVIIGGGSSIKRIWSRTRWSDGVTTSHTA